MSQEDRRKVSSKSIFYATVVIANDFWLLFYLQKSKKHRNFLCICNFRREFLQLQCLIFSSFLVLIWANPWVCVRFFARIRRRTLSIYNLEGRLLRGTRQNSWVRESLPPFEMESYKSIWKANINILRLCSYSFSNIRARH